jgi:hypothetical protein
VEPFDDGELGVVRTHDNAQRKLVVWMRRRRWRRGMANIVMSIVFGLMLAFALPRQFTEDLLTSKLARLAAPIVSAVDSSGSHNDITVVLIDQKSLRGHGWPATYDYYSDLLKQIGARSPKAIFIDVLLVHEHDKTLQKLKNTLADLSKRTPQHGPIKIFLAALRYDRGLTISPQMDTLPAGEVTKVAVEYEPAGVDHLAWFYPLIYRSGHAAQQTYHAGEVAAGPSSRAGAPHAAAESEANPEAGDISSAAFAIYRALYADAQAVPVDDAKTPSSIALSWGLRPSSTGPKNWIYTPTQEEESERHEGHEEHAMSFRKVASWLGLAQGEEGRERAANSEGAERGTYCSSRGETNHLLLLLRAEMHAIFPSVGIPLCAYHRTVIAGEIDEMEGSERQRDFGDKVVMIGTALDDGADYVVSPLHDRLPGVYLHAMALDNLITWNGDYVESREPEFGLSRDKWAVEGVALIGIIGVIALHTLRKKMKPAYRRLIEGRHYDSDHHHRTLREKPETGVFVVKTELHRVSERALPATQYLRGSEPPSIWRRIVSAVSWKVLTLCASIVLTIALLLLGQHIFHESYLAVAHVVACAMAAEWLEWGEKFVDFFIGFKESES